MAKGAQIWLRVEDEMKVEMQAEAAKLGLSLSSYLILLHKQNINKK